MSGTITIECDPPEVIIVTGDQGPQGPAGSAGQGVPAAGTTGQVLGKASATDYDTEWVTPADDFDPLSPGPIGSTTPSTGQFSSIAAGSAPVSGRGILSVQTWDNSNVPYSALSLEVTTSVTPAGAANILSAVIDGVQVFKIATDGTLFGKALELSDETAKIFSRPQTAPGATGADGTLVLSTAGRIQWSIDQPVSGGDYNLCLAPTTDSTGAEALGVYNILEYASTDRATIVADGIELGGTARISEPVTGTIEIAADLTAGDNAAPVVLTDPAALVPAGVTGAGNVLNMVSLTQAQYDSIAAPVATTLYIITD